MAKNLIASGAEDAENKPEAAEEAGAIPEGESSHASEAARALGKLGASKGGNARRDKLTPEERSEIAKKAVQARWDKAKGIDPNLPRATHAGVLPLGGLNIPCAVLDDGTRVLTQEGFLQAIGRAKKAKGGQGVRVDELPAFLAPNNLKPFISSDLAESTKPVIFTPLNPIGPWHKAYGYNAVLLPKVCRVYEKAYAAGALTKAQERVAKQCELILDGIATVGIVSLIDEATGFQDERPRNALAQILEQFLSKELANWARAFPQEFYDHLFRLKNWPQLHDPKSNKRPMIFAKLTVDLIYERLAPGVLEELRRRSPKNDKGRRRNALHQWLSEDIGHPKLREHFVALIALMRGHDKYENFYAMVNRSLPRYNVTMDLPFPLDDLVE